MTLYELIMTSTISDEIKQKLIEQISTNKMSKESIDKIVKILVNKRNKLNEITMEYIKNLDKLYAKNIKNDIRKIAIKEQKIEKNCKEIKQKIEEWNPEKILKRIK